MQPKHKTLVQAALLLMVLAFAVTSHSKNTNADSVAQKTVHARR